MATQPAIYTLCTNFVWANAVDPGHRRLTDVTICAATARDEQVIYDIGKLVFDSEINVQTALIDELNEAAPDKYKRMEGN